MRDRALRKEGRFGLLPMPLRAAIRTWVMERRYDLFLRVVYLSDETISLSRTIQNVVRRGTIIYHGAEPTIEEYGSINNNEQFRKAFELPLDKMLLLAYGYAGSYKGFDVLGSIVLPHDWSLVVKQTKHERGTEKPLDIKNENVISLNLGYLDDTTMSKLFFACDAIILPYKIVSISGVMFDALAHGLPFIASDLQFFREFAEMGLGIICNRDIESFERSIRALALAYNEYKIRVEHFRSELQWSNVAKKHIEFFRSVISRHNEHKDRAAKNSNKIRHN
jgi:glycosyltransferase involved in cell wall biosynthesis